MKEEKKTWVSPILEKHSRECVEILKAGNQGEAGFFELS
jgi:hypothetical protein